MNTDLQTQLQRHQTSFKCPRHLNNKIWTHKSQFDTISHVFFHSFGFVGSHPHKFSNPVTETLIPNQMNNHEFPYLHIYNNEDKI
jgi:hypothetical protein